MAIFDDMDVTTIWLDGSFVDWDSAHTHVLSHGLHYGVGIFEGVRCYDTEQGPAIFRWDDHLTRFYNSAKPYEMDIGYSASDLTDATLELLRRQNLNACYIRPIAFFGYDRLGLSPSGIPVQVAIACWPWGVYLGEEALSSGVEVMVSSWRRYSSNQVPMNAKTTGLYVNSVLASEEAHRNGFSEAILLNTDGNVAEGAGENIFLIRDGDIYTPDLSQGVLAGITRDTIITLAREKGYTVYDEAIISEDELYSADELFFTGTAAEVTPIKKVNETTIGKGSRGEITNDLQSTFFDVLNRRNKSHDEWFTYV
ncbi:MAG: branched-chain amino acid transaminase [Halobacteriales archaeon]|tara:strand:+ start:243 stop:1175 length:933 start_codon:yes stop_codon:yes gene_type:complete